MVLSRLLFASAAIGTAVLPGQSTWINVTPTTRPSPRCCAGMATDLSRGLVWLFSGGTSAAYPNDTWSWNGAAWTQLTPANQPSGRYGHTLVFDVQRGRAVLFGGNTSAGISGETWEFDGVNWTLMAPATAPSARYEHGMAYDTVRGRGVLFGGSSGGSETWEWDGVNWTQFNAATTPPTRRGHSMAFHTPSLRVVMFGGGSNLSDTWEWDGINWVQRTPPVSPSGRIYFSMCEDIARGRLVLFSGRPNFVMDTWEWDGASWTQRQPVLSLPGRSATAMAFDPAAGSPLLFGGITFTPTTTRYDESWRYVAVSAAFERQGAGCPGSAGVPDLGSPALPWVGQTWPVDLSNLPANAAAILNAGLSNTTWNSLSLPASLGAFGMPGCTLYMAPAVSVLLFASGTSASLNIAIPNNASLGGLAVYYQGLVLDPAAANAAHAVVTNAGKATLAVL